MSRFGLFRVSLALLIAASACRPDDDAAAPARDQAQAATGLSSADRVRLQGEASAACKCARATTDAKGKKACWAAFDKEKQARGGGEEVSGCGHFSQQYACFGAGLGDCVLTGASSVPEVTFCTEEEARIAEEGLFRAWEAGEKDEVAILMRYQKRFQSGEKLADIPPSSGGCAG